MPRRSRQTTDYLKVVEGINDGAVGLTDKAICDDCGRGAQLIVSDLLNRDLDVLCYQCHFNRAIAVATKLVQETVGEAPNA